MSTTTTTAPAVAAGTKVHIGHEVDGDLVGHEGLVEQLEAAVG